METKTWNIRKVIGIFATLLTFLGLSYLYLGFIFVKIFIFAIAVYAIYFIGHMLAERDILIGHIENDETRYIVNGENLVAIVHNRIGKVLHGRTNTFFALDASEDIPNEYRIYPGNPDWIWWTWGAVLIGIPPSRKMLSWEETYNTDAEGSEVAKRFEIKPVVKRLMKGLPGTRSEKILLPKISLFGAFNIDCAIRVELNHENAYDPVYSIKPIGSYMSNTIDQLRGRATDFVNLNQYEQLLESVHSKINSPFQNFMLEDGNTLYYGYRITSTTWLGFSLSIDERTVQIFKALQAVAIQKGFGLGNLEKAKLEALTATESARAIEILGNAYRRNPEMFRKAIADVVSDSNLQTLALALGDKMPFAITNTNPS